MGDCVGGVLCFDALCFSNHQRPGSPNNSSRNNSTESLKVGAHCYNDDTMMVMMMMHTQTCTWGEVWETINSWRKNIFLVMCD